MERVVERVVERRVAERRVAERRVVERRVVEKEEERGREREGGLEWRSEGEEREKRGLMGNECREWLDLSEVRKSGLLSPYQQKGNLLSSLWVQGWLGECGSLCTGRCA